MLTINKCKDILEENNEYFTDDEIKEIRAFLCKLAKVVINSTNEKEINYENGIER